MGKSDDKKHSASQTKDRKSKRRHRHDDEDRERTDRKKQKHSNTHVVDDDPNDEDMWAEKNIDLDGERERALASDIPTADSLRLTSHVSEQPSLSSHADTSGTKSSLTRDDWMLEPRSLQGAGSVAGPSHTNGEIGVADFFSTLGTEARTKKPQPNRPNPDKLTISSKELNTQLKEGKTLDQYDTLTGRTPNTPGGPGSQWRMMKLRRVYETAEEEGRSIEDVAVERFGALDAFEEAKEERRILDERRQHKSNSRDRERGGAPVRDGEKRWMFTDTTGSGAPSRSSSFRRPGGPSAPATPTPVTGLSAPKNKHYDSLRLPSEASTPRSRISVPSVMTPPVFQALDDGRRNLSTSELNKLQAKVLRAKLMGSANASELEAEYEASKAAGERPNFVTTAQDRIEVLPTLDAQGRLYDVGHGGQDDGPHQPGNRRKKDKLPETRDPQTGEVVRYNADDDTTTLGEMLRQEKFGAGLSDQKNLDAELAGAIMRDGKFEDNLDYIDDNADKLSRKKMRSDAMKRQFAIHDFKKTQKAMAMCQFCYGEDDSPPKAAIIATGTRCYLSCPLYQELVDGHCLIVPIQHHLTMLEGDDDLWDEVRNFMKCLIRMYAEDDKGVVFYETVLSIKHQKHTFIECVPLPWLHYEAIPAYFRESIHASETEWTQHKKLIDFSSRPGGFRRAMVSNLPYFMVQFDHKGEKGYGHVIEGVGDAAGAGQEDGAVEEGERGGEFPRWFAAEIIGNLLDIEPRRWRRPKRIDFRYNQQRVKDFRKKFDKFDWTPMIGQS